MESINSYKYEFLQAQEPSQCAINGQPVKEINVLHKSHPPRKYLLIPMAVSTPDYNRIPPMPGVYDPRLTHSIVSAVAPARRTTPRDDRNDEDDDDDDDDENEDAAVWWATTASLSMWSPRDPRKPWLRRGCDTPPPDPTPLVDPKTLSMTCLQVRSALEFATSAGDDPLTFPSSASSSPYAQTAALFN